MKYGYRFVLIGLLLVFSACGTGEAPAVEDDDMDEEIIGQEEETGENTDEEEGEIEEASEEESDEIDGDGDVQEDELTDEEEELWFFLGEWNRTNPANATLTIDGYTVEVAVEGSTIQGSIELESSTDATFTSDDEECELFFDVMERGTMQVTEETECSSLKASPEGTYHDY